MDVIAYYDYFLLLPYIVIFFLIARQYAKKKSETTAEFYWLLINWWLKMIAGILYAWMIVYYYRYGDPLGYKARSDELLDSISKDWGNIKYIFISVDDFRDYIKSLGYSNAGYLTVDFAYYTESNFMISRVSAFSAFFTFNRFLIISIVFTNLAYYGNVILYTALKKIIKNYNRELLIGCLFIPSCIFWSSGLAKEAICIISLGVIFNAAIKLFFQKKFSIITVLNFIFFSYVLYTVKDYLFVCFAFAFIIWLLYNLIKYLIAKSLLIKMGFILSFLILMAAIVRYSAVFSEIAVSNIGDIISLNKTAYESMSAATVGGGSLIEIGDIDFTSVAGILKFIPRGLVNVFFRPFPWEIANVLMVFTVLENLLFIFLLFKVFIKTKFFTSGLFIQKNYHLYAILFTITLAFIIGISTFNMGTMVRYKMPFLPFWATFLLIVNKKLTDNKNIVAL